MVTKVIQRYIHFKTGYIRWRCLSSSVEKVYLCFSFALLTGLAAQIRIPLPFTPVPLTGQTFAVLLSGLLLGGRWGAVSQLMYVGMGGCGIPWFAGWKGGFLHLLGPTGGYLAGFIPAAFLAGQITSSSFILKRLHLSLFCLAAANFLLIHGTGLLGLYLWMGASSGIFPHPLQLFKMGTVPFIPGDVIKILFALFFTRKFLLPPL
ncbi:biotin transporter BioY, partial [Candidatus Aerophobetes bacterium]|nr:biotin transporter BioY [Candidatus Aerophobetes bacterium]